MTHNKSNHSADLHRQRESRCLYTKEESGSNGLNEFQIHRILYKTGGKMPHLHVICVYDDPSHQSAVCL